MTSPLASPDHNIGRILEDRYELIDLLGTGSMGRVYLGRHTMLGGAVAVKFLSKAMLRPAMQDRFLNEAKTCAHLGQESIHIVRVSDFGVDEQDIPFYVMEYLQGQSLGDLVKSEPLPLSRFLEILRQICLGLKTAHEGISLEGKRCPVIHRDIKPSNILVTPDATLGELTKILDFGIAQLVQGDQNQPEGFTGTLAYSSPEQMEGQEPTPGSDIYSLGVLMFRCLTGELPIRAVHSTFGGWYKAHCQNAPAKISDVAPHLQLPQALTSLIYGCLEKQPENRPTNLSEILDELQGLEPAVTSQELPTATLVQSSAVPSSSGKTVVAEPKKPPSIEEICLGQRWPQGKPASRIVFPQPLKTSEGTKASLWAMLPEAEIQQFALSCLYTQVYRRFLCMLSPSPMLMWVTALNSRFFADGQDARWLPCFLDLKSSQGQRFTRLLAAQGEYQVLFFTLEQPHRCAHVLKATISEAQCRQLGQWAIAAQTQFVVGQPAQSKQILRRELAQLKEQQIFETKVSVGAKV